MATGWRKWLNLAISRRHEVGARRLRINAKGEGADAENLGRAAKKRIGASFLNAGWAAKEREKHRMWMAVGDSVAYERRALNRKIKHKKCDYAVLTVCNNARDQPVHVHVHAGTQTRPIGQQRQILSSYFCLPTGQAC